jgi:phosphopantetheinyl transferase
VIELREINPDITIGILDLRAYSEQHQLVAKRDIEKSGTRELLKQLLGNKDFELWYTPENKPYLRDSDIHISISHSHDKLVIICNKRANTGIDIELVRDKVQNIQHKYLSE